MVFELLGSGGALRFRDADAPLRGLRHHAEQASALLVKGARELTRQKSDPALRRVHSRAAECSASTTSGILGCPVRFQAEWDAVIFSEETLQLPVVGADNKLLRVLEAACRQHRRPPAAQGRPRPFGARIRRASG